MRTVHLYIGQTAMRDMNVPALTTEISQLVLNNRYEKQRIPKNQQSCPCHGPVNLIDVLNYFEVTSEQKHQENDLIIGKEACLRQQCMQGSQLIWLEGNLETKIWIMQKMDQRPQRKLEVQSGQFFRAHLSSFPRESTRLFDNMQS